MTSAAPEPAIQSSYDAGPAAPLLLEETIGANLERTVAEYGDSEALVECQSGRRWTYTELNDAVNEVARGLLGLGIETGVDLQALVETSAWMAGHLGRPSPSRVVKALAGTSGAGDDA